MKADVGGIGIHYRLDGPARAPVVMMSHSLMCDGSMWGPQMDALADFRVLRVDTRGHGASDAPDGSYSLEQLADDYLGLMDHLEIERVHFVGLSMGGMIGQVLGLKAGDRLHTLTLCDTMSAIPAGAENVWQERIDLANAEGMEAHVAGTIERWFSESFCRARPDAVEPIRELIRTTPISGFAGCCLAISGLDLTDRLSAISMPTLVIVGRDDPGTTVAMAEVMRDNIPGAEMVVIDNALHLSNIEQPEDFNAALTGFLAEHT
jgi:3-oxoadipate enol-lactonase